MRPTSFEPQVLCTYLRRHRIGDLPALKQVLDVHARNTTASFPKQLLMSIRRALTKGPRGFHVVT
jgi:hypothetical protein